MVEKELNLTCMTMLEAATGWFEIVEVPTYITTDFLKKLTNESIDESSARISQFFDQTWLSRYRRLKNVIFDNGSEIF